MVTVPDKAIDLIVLAKQSGWEVAVTTDVIDSDTKDCYVVMRKGAGELRVNWSNGNFKSGFQRKPGKAQTKLRNAGDARRILQNEAVEKPFRVQSAELVSH